MRISYIFVLLPALLPKISQSAEYEVKHAGAFENLKDEIQIFYGKPYSSYVILFFISQTN